MGSGKITISMVMEYIATNLLSSSTLVNSRQISTMERENCQAGITFMKVNSKKVKNKVKVKKSMSGLSKTKKGSVDMSTMAISSKIVLKALESLDRKSRNMCIKVSF